MCFSTLWSFSMKKTLVALAVLAAGAASAQVTITGGYTFGYQQVTGGNGGLYTDGAGLTFSATEDLGNGTTASAKVSAGGFHRAKTVAGEDAALTLAGSFGSVELATKETGHGTSSAWIAPGYGLDGGTGGFGGGTPKDRITYKAPAMGAFGLSVSYTDRGDALTADGKQNGTAGAGGTTGTLGAQNYATAGVTYADSGLSLGLSYTSFMHRDLPSAKASGITVSAAYDAGVAKVALAVDKANTANASYALGVSAPLGAALTAGVNYGKAESGKTGYTIGANYAVSKSVNVGVSSKDLADSADKAFRVLVSKSF
jgi:Gram-negative porin